MKNRSANSSATTKKNGGASPANSVKKENVAPPVSKKDTTPVTQVAKKDDKTPTPVVKQDATTPTPAAATALKKDEKPATPAVVKKEEKTATPAVAAAAVGKKDDKPSTPDAAVVKKDDKVATTSVTGKNDSKAPTPTTGKKQQAPKEAPKAPNAPVPKKEEKVVESAKVSPTKPSPTKTTATKPAAGVIPNPSMIDQGLKSVTVKTANEAEAIAVSKGSCVAKSPTTKTTARPTSAKKVASVRPFSAVEISYMVSEGMSGVTVCEAARVETGAVKNCGKGCLEVKVAKASVAKVVATPPKTPTTKAVTSPSATTTTRPASSSSTTTKNSTPTPKSAASTPKPTVTKSHPLTAAEIAYVVEEGMKFSAVCEAARVEREVVVKTGKGVVEMKKTVGKGWSNVASPAKTPNTKVGAVTSPTKASSDSKAATPNTAAKARALTAPELKYVVEEGVKAASVSDAAKVEAGAVGKTGKGALEMKSGGGAKTPAKATATVASPTKPSTPTTKAVATSQPKTAGPTTVGKARPLSAVEVAYVVEEGVKVASVCEAGRVEAGVVGKTGKGVVELKGGVKNAWTDKNGPLAKSETPNKTNASPKIVETPKMVETTKPANTPKSTGTPKSGKKGKGKKVATPTLPPSPNTIGVNSMRPM
ncbi:hypothetical protein HDU67_009239 [Dinochytrium kinnereticum]|nr:hypothetical protein HDU67_009239 [Dinochytrium kinnereticum]